MATVAPTPRSTTYTLASVSAGPFNVGFRLFDVAGLAVFINGVRITAFTVSATFANGFTDSATITLNSAAAIGDVIRIDGAMTPQRGQDYVNPDPALTSKLNIELGRLTATVSDLSLQTQRSLRLGASTDPFTPVDDATIIWDAGLGRFRPGPTELDLQAALDAAASAADSEVQAQKWAQNPEDTAVTPGMFSSFHWAKKGEKSAASATLSSAAAGQASARLVVATWPELQTKYGYTAIGGRQMVAAGDHVWVLTIGAMFRVADQADGNAHLRTGVVGLTWNADAPRYYVLAGSDGFDARAFGATGDGVTDDTWAVQAAVTRACNARGKAITPRANYLITQPIVANAAVAIDGQMSNFYQATADTDIFVFDKGSSGAGNYLNGLDVKNIVARTALGTGNAFVFRNTNESTFENLLVVGCGGTAFDIQGCILSKWTHCYVGNGLSASPGFYRAGAIGNARGFELSSLNGLACNTNTFDRCTATNSTETAAHITGTGNIWIGFDAEGISLPAIAMLVEGQSTTIIGGNLEGTGGNIDIRQSHCTVEGANVLGALSMASGVTGTNVIGGNVKQLIFSAGSLNNTVIGTRISTGGFVVDNGSNNLRINVYNSVTATEVGMFNSGNFSPILNFGGAAGVSAYFQQKGSWWRMGNIVHFNLWVQANTFTAATGAATISLNDIPFTPVGPVDIPVSVGGNGVPTGTGAGNVAAMIDGGTKNIMLQKYTTATGVVSNLTNADFTSADQIFISGFFPLTLNA